MSEMSRAQGQPHNDPNPTDDMVPPAARVPDSYVEKFGPKDGGAEDAGPQDFGAEDVGPQDFGAEDVNSQDFDESQPAAEPLPTAANSGGENSGLPAESSSDPMPDIAGQG
jgi:hypothetical protein